MTTEPDDDDMAWLDGVLDEPEFNEEPSAYDLRHYRLECLKLSVTQACQPPEYLTTDRIIARADMYTDFVLNGDTKFVLKRGE